MLATSTGNLFNHTSDTKLPGFWVSENAVPMKWTNNGSYNNNNMFILLYYLGLTNNTSIWKLASNTNYSLAQYYNSVPENDHLLAINSYYCVSMNEADSNQVTYRYSYTLWYKN